MSLEDISDDVIDAYGDFGDELAVSLDRETKNELAMLEAVFEPDEPDELVRRAVHMLFQTTVETGTLDFHLRSKYDLTYDEYLTGMTFEEMSGGVGGLSSSDDERRYQF